MCGGLFTGVRVAGSAPSTNPKQTCNQLLLLARSLDLAGPPPPPPPPPSPPGPGPQRWSGATATSSVSLITLAIGALLVLAARHAL